MARNFKYKEYAHVEKICGDSEYRYLLTVSLADGDPQKTALVVMQNPSKATKEISDQTVNTVLKVLHRFGYAKVHITNLIPLYGTHSADVSDLAEQNQQIYKENDLIISELAASVSKIFVGWGGCNAFSPDFYFRRIAAVRRLLHERPVYCYAVNHNGTPIHPSRGQWKDDKDESEFIRYQFPEYNVTDDFQQSR